MSLHPRLRLIEVEQRDGVTWPELGYHFDNIPGLAVNQTERQGAEWWTLTHIATRHSVGFVVSSKEVAAAIGDKLSAIDWRPRTYPAAVVRSMHERVRQVAAEFGLIVRHQVGGAVEFLDPDLAALEARLVLQREQQQQEAGATT